MPSNYFMQDLDAMFGSVVFGHNTGDRLFLEYVPDNYENRTSMIREFALIAMFDRKSNEQCAYNTRNILSRAFYLWTCRTLSAKQPIPARFFYCFGGQEPPWRLVELDINTGFNTRNSVVLDGKNWLEVWQQLGLSQLRSDLAKWLG